jgi:hypothetical protein
MYLSQLTTNHHGGHFKVYHHTVEIVFPLLLEKKAEHNRGIKITSRTFQNLPQLRYLRATVTNQNLIQEEIKGGLISGNAY